MQKCGRNAIQCPRGRAGRQGSEPASLPAAEHCSGHRLLPLESPLYVEPWCCLRKQRKSLFLCICICDVGVAGNPQEQGIAAESCSGAANHPSCYSPTHLPACCCCLLVTTQRHPLMLLHRIQRMQNAGGMRPGRQAGRGAGKQGRRAQEALQPAELCLLAICCCSHPPSPVIHNNKNKKHKNAKMQKYKNTQIQNCPGTACRIVPPHPYLIFVTSFTSEICGEKFVMLRNFRFICMTDVEKSEISTLVE